MTDKPPIRATLTADFAPDHGTLALSTTEGFTDREILRFTNGDLLFAAPIPGTNSLRVHPFPPATIPDRHLTGETVHFLGPYLDSFLKDR